jgi:hypothetical protein
MKKIFKFLFSIVGVVYVAVAVFTTAFLLNRNDYSVTQFGESSLFIVNEDEMQPYYCDDTLLVIEKKANESIEIGEKIFYYDIYSNEKVIKFNEVTKKEKITDVETTFTTKDNSVLSSEYVIGSESTTTDYVLLGSVLNVLQSKWGFLFIIVFPLFLAFIYEIYAIVKEVREG